MGRPRGCCGFSFQPQLMPREKRKQGTGPKSWLLNVLWYRVESLLSALEQLQMHHFSLGRFSTLGYQIMSPAQSLGEVRVMEMEIFCGVSEIFSKSPRKPEITETPVDPKWLPVSQPDTAKHKLNGCGWSTAIFVHQPRPCHCLSVPGHTCFHAVSLLFLSCRATDWAALFTRVRMLEVTLCSMLLTSPLTKCSTKTSHSEEHVGANKPSGLL